MQSRFLPAGVAPCDVQRPSTSQSRASLTLLIHYQYEYTYSSRYALPTTMTLTYGMDSGQATTVDKEQAAEDSARCRAMKARRAQDVTGKVYYTCAYIIIHSPIPFSQGVPNPFVQFYGSTTSGATSRKGKVGYSLSDLQLAGPGRFFTVKTQSDTNSPFLWPVASQIQFPCK